LLIRLLTFTSLHLVITTTTIKLAATRVTTLATTQADIPSNMPAGDCPYDTMATDGENNAPADVDLSAFDHIQFILPDGQYDNCGWGGLGEVSGSYTWINGAYRSLITHELGHNIGWLHANTPTDEYADCGDIMGCGSYGFTFPHGPRFSVGRWWPYVSTCPPPPCYVNYANTLVYVHARSAFAVFVLGLG
jgi:hypothetical protein